MKILFFILSLLQPLQKEEIDAIHNYQELQFTCVPKNLKSEHKDINYLGNVYVLKYDMNNIPWVVETKKDKSN